MKIMLINPIFYKFFGSHDNSAKLGLGYLSAILSRNGYEVYQYNADYVNTDTFPTQKDLFENSNGIKESGNPRHPVYKEVYEMIDKVSPDVIGLTITSGTVDSSEVIAAYAKEKGIHVIVGGPMVTLAVDELLKINVFDQFVLGEAEKVILRVIENRQSKVYNGIPVMNLDTLPFPQKDNYVGDIKFLKYNSVMTTRGCPYRCKPCCHWVVGNNIRFRSPNNVIREIEELVNRFGVNNIRFFDDTFTLKRNRVLEMAKLIQERLPGLKFLIETRPERVEEDVLKELVKAGLYKMKIGVESGSQRIINKYRGGHYTIDMVRNTVKLLKKYGVDVSINIMYGFDDETNEELRMTIDLIKELEPTYTTISSTCPYPGTELFYSLPKDLQKDWKYYNHTSKIPIMNKNLDEDLINELININNN